MKKIAGIAFIAGVLSNFYPIKATADVPGIGGETVVYPSFSMHSANTAIVSLPVAGVATGSSLLSIPTHVQGLGIEAIEAYSLLKWNFKTGNQHWMWLDKAASKLLKLPEAQQQIVWKQVGDSAIDAVVSPAEDHLLSGKALFLEVVQKKLSSFMTPLEKSVLSDAQKKTAEKIERYKEHIDNDASTQAKSLMSSRQEGEVQGPTAEVNRPAQGLPGHIVVEISGPTLNGEGTAEEKFSGFIESIGYQGQLIAASGDGKGGETYIALILVPDGEKKAVSETITAKYPGVVIKDIDVATRISELFSAHRQGELKSNEKIRLPIGTPIQVVLLDEVSGETAKVGDALDLKVVKPVKLNGMVLIPEGAPANGVVDAVLSPKRFGIPGSISVKINSVKAVDGSVISVRGKKSQTGGSYAEQIGFGLIMSVLGTLFLSNSWGLGTWWVWLPIGFGLLGLLFRGDHGVLSSASLGGSSFEATTSDSVSIDPK